MTPFHLLEADTELKLPHHNYEKPSTHTTTHMFVHTLKWRGGVAMTPEKVELVDRDVRWAVYSFSFPGIQVPDGISDKSHFARPNNLQIVEQLYNC